MRAYVGLAATLVVATFIGVAHAHDGVPRRPASDAAKSVAPREPRSAPLPATAWAGLTMISGILIVRRIRRRAD